MSHRLKLTALVVTIILLTGYQPPLRAQGTPGTCVPSAAPYAWSYFSLPSVVFAGERFYQDVVICDVPAGKSIAVHVNFVSQKSGVTVFSSEASTDINEVASVQVPSGLPADTYNLTYSNPDGSNLPGAGYLAVQEGNALTAMNGLYVFLFKGVSVDASPAGAPKQTHILGSFIADGNGNITGGEADINSPLGLQEKVSITGAYTLDYTGRGTLELVSALGTLRFSLSLSGAQIYPVAYRRGSLTSAGGSSLVGTGSLNFADPNIQYGPPYANTVVRLTGETTCDAACRVAGHFAESFTVSGNLCLGCLPNTVAGGPELYRVVYSLVAGNSTKTGLVQTGSLGPTDAFARSVMSADAGNAAGLPQRYAVYEIDSENEYLLSLDPHDRAALVSGNVIAARSAF